MGPGGLVSYIVGGEGGEGPRGKGERGAAGAYSFVACLSH